MSIKSKMTTLMLLAMASGGLMLQGCPTDTCTLDTDCEMGNVCEAESCVATCVDDTECADGEICGARAAGEGNICQEGTVVNNNPVETCDTADDPTAFCVMELGDDTATCNTELQLCELPPAADPITVVQVLDISTEAGACDGDDPGSDIWKLTLLNGDGEILGHARAVADASDLKPSSDDMNAYVNATTVFDGTAPDPRAGDDTCPAEVGGERFSPEAIVSLGCDGYLVVEFIDDADQVIPLQEGYQIQSGEYADQCFQDGMPGDEANSTDVYQLYVCTDSTVSECEAVGGTELRGYPLVPITTLPMAATE